LIAVISDIHSNLEALIAVLEDIKSRDIEKILVLGDVIGYGPNPKECLELINDLNPEVTLMGNHEHALVHGCPTNMHPRARVTLEWTKEQLSREQLEQLSNWPTSHQVDSIFAVHASPRHHVMEYIFPYDIKRAGLMKERFELVPTNCCVVGHVHIPGVFTQDLRFIRPSELTSNIYLLEDDHKAIINVGSVGQPRDLDNRACYTTIDEECVVFRRVPYDFRKTQQKILNIKGFDPFLAQRLEMGR
jgi:diadenosine tetraphosphatase ApaH/serine/threonine PP2A family protein phosphatase